MGKRALLIHISLSLIIGGLISYFSEVKWLAASFWVSAAMFANGSLAYVEDGLPGGFDNPDGKDTPEYSKGHGATKFALKSFAVILVLFTIGIVIQVYL